MLSITRPTAAALCLVGNRVPEEVAASFQVWSLVFWKTAEALERIEELLAHRPAGGELADFLPALMKPTRLTRSGAVERQSRARR